MKKILFFMVLFVLLIPLALIFAQENTTVTLPVNIHRIIKEKIITTKPISITVNYNPTCASSAVVAHEDAQENILETRQASMKIVYTVRRNALGAAYLLTEKKARDTAIKVARDAFLVAQKIADGVAMDASKKENELFKATMAGCGAKLPPPTRDQMNNQNGSDSNQFGFMQNLQDKIKLNDKNIQPQAISNNSVSQQKQDKPIPQNVGNKPKAQSFWQHIFGF